MNERRQARILTRTFFSRLFESDMMPPGLTQIQLAVSVIAFLTAPAVVGPILLAKKYVWLAGVPVQLAEAIRADRTVAFLLAMIATGFVTMVIWENVFPDRRDARVLGILPVRQRTFVFARLAALVMLFALLVFSMTAALSVSFGVVELAFLGTRGFFEAVFTNFVTAAGLEAAVFFGIIGLQCALLNIFGPVVAQRLAVALQVAMVILVLQIPLLWPVIGRSRIPGEAPLTGLVAAVLALGLYAASYRRLTRLAIEGTQPSRRVVLLWGVVGRLSQWTSSHPATRATCAFVLRTVLRSRQHRMLVAGWMGLAVAIVLATLLPPLLRGNWTYFDRPRTYVLAVPLVLIALTLVGARMAFAIPVEVRANWTFRVRPPVPPRRAVDGAAAALVVSIGPWVLLAFASAAGLWGARAGLFHATFCALLGSALALLFATGLDKVPFTCTYVPGKARFTKLWPLYLFAFSLFTFTMAAMEADALEGGGRTKALLFAGVLLLIAAFNRERRAREVRELRFEETEADALTLVSLSQERPT